MNSPAEPAIPTKESTCTLITGASSGIGRAIAIHLSRSRRLILHGRDIERLNETRALSSNSHEHIIWPYDFQNIAGLAASLGSIIAESGVAVECFVHSAGLLKVLPIRSVDYRALNEVMNVNFFSAAEITSLLVKKKVNRQQLRTIVLISSIISGFGAPGFSPYAASKGALDSFMRNLAVELAPAVRVNSILPGGIRTEMTSDMLEQPGVAEKFARDYPLGIGEPDDIVSATEYLVSDKARWVTGQQFVIDGGRTVNISI